MIRVSENKTLNTNQITYFERYKLCKSNRIICVVDKKYIRGSFWKALFNLDFSKKEVKIYYRFFIGAETYIGDWNDLVKYCAESKERQLIRNKVYENPRLVIHTSDGECHIIFFDSDKEMRKMEKKIICETRNY